VALAEVLLSFLTISIRLPDQYLVSPDTFV
jgi:hypothetical protein